MKSGWMVRHRYTYEVYRLKDAQDTEGEVEVYEVYEKRNDALYKAKELNKEAAERFWKGCN